MREQIGYAEDYERALRVAAVAHRGQTRKGSVLPYFTHPVHVSMILARHGFSGDVLVAALLHDVVEDQGYPLARIEAQFGARVARVVDGLTERKLDDRGQARPWEVRKREAVAHIRESDVETVAVKLADTLHNAQSIILDVRRVGPKVWTRFKREPEATVWYYGRVLAVGRERMPGHPLVDELAEALAELESLAEAPS